MTLKVIYQDSDVLVIDKPAGIVVYSENPAKEKTLIDYILEEYPEIKNVGEKPRYGIVHRLDKETSGIILIAKNNSSLLFFQKKFKNREVDKGYIALVTGEVNPVRDSISNGVKLEQGRIETLLGRSPKNKLKQTVYLPGQPGAAGKRKARTEYRVIERFEKYTLVKVFPKNGRKHQIRCHFAYIQHPIAGDKLYGFKNQPLPPGLNRHFLHADYLKIKLPKGEVKEFKSELPQELIKVIDILKSK